MNDELKEHVIVALLVLIPVELSVGVGLTLNMLKIPLVGGGNLGWLCLLLWVVEWRWYVRRWKRILRLSSTS